MFMNVFKDKMNVTEWDSCGYLAAYPSIGTISGVIKQNQTEVGQIQFSFF